MNELKEQFLTEDDGRKALIHHIVEKGLGIREKYGPNITWKVLQKVLQDGEFIKFPTRVIFNSQVLESGMFAVAEPISDDKSDGYAIYVHEHFKDKLEDVPPMVLYHLVTVNYGEFATYDEAEIFGATVLGYKQEYYYQLLCCLADSIPGGS